MAPATTSILTALSVCSQALAAAVEVSLAATTVSPVNSVANASYFVSEIQQLTDSVLRTLGSHQSLFNFGDANLSLPAVGTCKVYPGDAAWPSTSQWSVFNQALGGALIKTVPLAATCYPAWSEYYNQTACEEISDDWTVSYLHAADPASIMWPLFEGRSCLPTDIATSSNCTIGGYSSYAVNVSTVAQIQLAVNFARNQRLRLTVKNTGHDFNGKSTGAGALGIWTHNLKDIEVYDDYRLGDYRGPAVKLGAGVQAFEVYEKAHELGYTAVGGEGKTVGVAGGYVLGGGHSPMSSVYGLAADQVLALEVVLANGRFVTVTEQSNSDLFWALRGGGGGTYGIVTSLIARLHPKTPVTVSTFSFATSTNVTADTFWAGVDAYMKRFPANADAGTYAYFWIIKLGEESYEFLMNPYFAVNHTVAEFNALMAPWFAELDCLGIPYSPNTTYYDNFYEAWDAGFPLETVGSVTMMTGSRLIPRENFVNATLFHQTAAAFRSTVSAGYSLLAFNLKAELPAGYPASAANPAFRTTLMHAITSTSWYRNATNTEIKATMDTFTYDVLGEWRKTCPDSGAYMSEADIQEPDFQQAFYGDFYTRLYALKQRWDPAGLFYAPTAVGSEDWEVRSLDGLPDQNGRLCRV
ncbi:FAD-binding domain-containing protein [Aspergillus saccharolyticus JOP 1030-1]|uniref:FAD-binding domain-containing protein n=1 Tax=Aspergillus saccharolyticus JOP 1030-1 TaxID=1450539 RepID=A0A318Z9B1_9EURO|nr:FAD-binding domain-containing protein [Aspergillus saccharolyticus JOP 1030-1]PYH42964.1 FAD-binding domain-containing protein [Aspergillus saccharolyticus JOP 1030-1]